MESFVKNFSFHAGVGHRFEICENNNTLKNFGQVVDYFHKRVCMRSALVIHESTTFLQDLREQFILNYKLTELEYNLR
jgi:hypothetical protein